jgi:hemerythrin
MSFMDWSIDYEIGIPEMDSQHKKWLELLNRFYDHLNTGEFNKKLLD